MYRFRCVCDRCTGVDTFYVYNTDGICNFSGEQYEEQRVKKSQVPDAAEDVNNGFSIAYNNDGGSLSAPIKILLFLTVITLAPSILIMLTSFTRIIVVLHFLRSAIGTQTSPPNQVLIGLALFLTLFIMSPVFTQINEKAIKPLDAGEITQEEALEIGMEPLREFMFGQTQVKDINLFCEIANVTYEDKEELQTPS